MSLSPQYAIAWSSNRSAICCMLNSGRYADAFFGDGDGGRGWRHSGDIAAWIIDTTNTMYMHSKRNTYHARLTCIRIMHCMRTGARHRCACVFLLYLFTVCACVCVGGGGGCTQISVIICPESVTCMKHAVMTSRKHRNGPWENC